MTLSTIDSDAALVVIDLQVATSGLPTVPTAASDIISRSVQLANAFRDKGHKVVWVNVAGGTSGRTSAGGGGGDLPDNWSDLIPELGVQDDDVKFTKYAWGAFHDDRFDALLKELGVTQVFLTGITTSFGVESTARSAYERNYNVVVVSDAVGDLDADAHQNSIDRIFPGLGEVETTAGVLARL